MSIEAQKMAYIGYLTRKCPREKETSMSIEAQKMAYIGYLSRKCPRPAKRMSCLYILK
jgi:phage FluMu protein Com